MEGRRVRSKEDERLRARWRHREDAQQLAPPQIQALGSESERVRHARARAGRQWYGVVCLGEGVRWHGL
jgi:hypothetical protein